METGFRNTLTFGVGHHQVGHIEVSKRARAALKIASSLLVAARSPPSPSVSTFRGFRVCGGLDVGQLSRELNDVGGSGDG
ncbi:hypothetical protein TYRP_015458 [Tyrophagus putrescentiae]|nr:hypothetical protein TYRP_015458 [Tyrophagus putrescentiae]